MIKNIKNNDLFKKVRELINYDKFITLQKIFFHLEIHFTNFLVFLNDFMQDI